MKTKKVTISERVIKSYLSDPEVYQLRDKGAPLILRFNKARTGGSWYAVNYRKGQKPLTKFASYPLVSASLAKKKLPEHLASKEKKNIDHFEKVGDLLSWHLMRAEADRDITAGRKAAIKTAINKHLLPRLFDCPIKELNKKRLLSDLILPMQQQYETATISNVFKVLRAAALAANELELLEPCKLIGIQFKNFRLKRPKRRDARLSLAELPELMNKLKHYPVTHERTLVLMMLFHGTRIMETANAQWKHIDFKNWIWTLPAIYTKTGKRSGKAFKIPLSEKAVFLLMQWHTELVGKRKYKGKYIFPATIRTAISDNPISDTRAHELIKLIACGDWTAHDTRKCCSDSWLEMGFDSLIIECQLNHAKGTQTQAYFQKETNARRLAMLEHWHNFLTFVKDSTETTQENEL